MSRRYSLVRVWGLLIVVVSLTEEHGLWVLGFHCGAGLSCPAARGMSPDQGSNMCPCIGGQILNHWTTKEVHIFKKIYVFN